MTGFVPLIRAAAAVPWIRWLRENGRPVTELLEAADCAYFPWDDPNRPVPLLNLITLIVQTARREGNDIGCRVVTNTSVHDLANLGALLLRDRSIGAALETLIRVSPRHSTHEVYLFERTPDGASLTELWHWTFDDEALHLIQQYVAAMIESFCRLTAELGPWFSGLWLLPHPETGVSHLSGHFGGIATPHDRRHVTMNLPQRVVDAGVTGGAQVPAVSFIPFSDWHSLRGGGAFSASAGVAMDAILGSGRLTVDRLAASAGMSVRSLQRRLMDDGMTFSKLLDAARYRRFTDRVAEGDRRFDRLARELGFAHPSALTRAVRRWTGMSPRELLRADRHILPGSGEADAPREDAGAQG